MTNTYAIIAHGNSYAVTKNDRMIILSATKQTMTFPTIEAAQSFVTINRNADDRHSMPYGK